MRLAAVSALVAAAAVTVVATGGARSDGPVLRAKPGGCQVLPKNDAFHERVDGLDPAGNSDAIIDQINDKGPGLLHPDFGSNPHYGIPYEVVSARQRKVPIKVTLYPGQSDKGKQPIPPNAPIEGGRRSSGDRHTLVIQKDGKDADHDCTLIELYRAKYLGGPKHRWKAGQVSVFDLGRKLPQRKKGWTSADAAGLPILPGLVRPDEVRRGRIDHAIRITFDETRRAYLSPATHYASDICAANVPPMGMRFRLRPGYSLAGFSGQAKVVATALKEYGAIVADNGTDWYITGAKSRKWNDENLNQLKEIPGDDFQVVDTGAELTSGCG